MSRDRAETDARRPDRPDHTPESATSDGSRAAAIVRRLGREPESVSELAGFDNHVHRVRGDGFDWVVRRPARHDGDYRAELWALQAARAAGVPTSTVVATIEGDDPALVLQYVSEADPAEQPWRQLGEHAATLARIDLAGAPDGLFSRFGRDLEAAWAAHLRYNLDALVEGDPVLALGGYSAPTLPTLRGWIEDLQRTPLTHGLVHGDLDPRHLIGEVLIDFGCVTTGPAPWQELVQIERRRLLGSNGSAPATTAEEVAAFAAGAGLDLTSGNRRILRSLVALQAVDLVRWAIDRAPDQCEQYARDCAAALTALLAD